MERTRRFIIFLAGLSLSLIILRVLLSLLLKDSTPTLQHFFINQLFFFLYAFMPAVAVLLTQKNGLKNTLKEYSVTLRGINTKAFFRYSIGTAIIYPAFFLLLILLFGNILEIGSFGKIGIAQGKYSLYGIMLPENTMLRTGIFILILLLGSLLMGLTYNMLIALGGEIAWRGFLQKELKGNQFKKNIIVGLIWATWYMPILIIKTTGPILEIICSAVLMYLLFVALSFLLFNSVRNTRSLFAPAAVLGIIFSTQLFNFTPEPPKSGIHTMLIIVSVILIHILFNKTTSIKTKSIA